VPVRIQGDSRWTILAAAAIRLGAVPVSVASVRII
jgi:hypothetical protein